jgi:WhiB family redox-sensing transcriptional regulator
MPKYEEIKWEQGECYGSGTDLFYSVEEERKTSNNIYISAVRSICARCPIFTDCLTYAFAHEKYGVWGGLTSMERKSVKESRFTLQKQRAFADLSQYGISRDTIQGCLEDSKK